MRVFVFPILIACHAHAEEHAVTRHHLPGPIHQHHTHPVDNESAFALSATLGYDSRYVTEGRDNLAGDGILHGGVEASFKDFLFMVWYGESPHNSYNELNLILEYGFKIREFDCYVGYNHLRFPDDREHDHEVGAGLSYNALPLGLGASADWYYSFENNGSFFEFALVRPYEICEWFQIETGIVFGVNDGYVPDGHQGANHIAASLAATLPVNECFEWNAFASYNWSIDADPIFRPGDDGLEDFFYAGFSSTYSF